MVAFLLPRLFALLLTLLMTWCRSTAAKDLEILALRHQFAVLQQRQPPALRLTWWKKMPLALLIVAFKRVAKETSTPWRPAVVLASPDTVLRWHRELVRRKWTRPTTLGCDTGTGGAAGQGRDQWRRRRRRPDRPCPDRAIARRARP